MQHWASHCGWTGVDTQSGIPRRHAASRGIGCCRPVRPSTRGAECTVQVGICGHSRIWRSHPCYASSTQSKAQGWPPTEATPGEQLVEVPSRLCHSILRFFLVLDFFTSIFSWESLFLPEIRSWLSMSNSLYWWLAQVTGGRGLASGPGTWPVVASAMRVGW